VRFPVDDAEQEAGILPWGDGFLAITVDRSTKWWRGDDPSQLHDRRIQLGAGRGVDAARPAESLAESPRSVIVSSSQTPSPRGWWRRGPRCLDHDLRNWSSQDFDLPGARPLGDQSQLGVWWPSMRSFAVNETGWVFEIVRMYSADVTSVLPSDVQRDLVAGPTRSARRHRFHRRRGRA
jgi:hypothetical protein